MHLERLKGRKVSARLLKDGTHWKGNTLNIRWMRGAPRHPNVDPEQSAVYIGTFASSKLDKSAVKRNRMRRRCREALRTAIKNSDNLPTVQLLISPRSASLTCDFGEIKDDVSRFLSSLT